MSIRRLWAGMLTKNTTDAGTPNPIVLVINENGTDRLQKAFTDTREQGRANLYEVDVTANNINPENLNDSSIHVGIQGENQWEPEHFIVWGEQSNDNAIIPMAIETGLNVGISAQPDEGKLSFPVRLVNSGNGNTQINRLLMLMKTRNVEDAETDSSITLRVIGQQGDTLVDFSIPDTPQWEQERGEANLYFVPVNASFTKGGISGIRLSIGGADTWAPASFFLFGLDDASGRPETLVPLVHIPNWVSGGLGRLSTNSSQGSPSVLLPLI